MRRILLLIFTFLAVSSGYSQQFDAFFRDSTLRIDYIFAGNAKAQSIYVDKLNMMPRWYGKHRRLAEVPVEGNGQIIVRRHRSEEIIYKNSFSTLFQEWLSYPEAETEQRSFENVFLIPMPKDTVDVTIELRNNRREVMTALTHTVNPQDILIHHIGKTPTDYEIIQQAKDTSNCIHIAYVAEGYQPDEMGVFLKDARTAMEALFQHEPFKKLKERFQIIAVKSPSKDSGTSIPGKGIWKETALGSHFNTFYSDRYLTTLNIKRLHDWLAGTPYEHIIVLVNTDNYGGGGILNSYNLSMTHHPSFKPVVVHEFGHSFAGLADEYAYEQEQIPMYPADIEPWEPNITTLKDFDSKWKNLKGAGLYEGAGYSLKGVYRAYQDCRMRTNEHPVFCPVCQQAIERLIRFYTE